MPGICFRVSPASCVMSLVSCWPCARRPRFFLLLQASGASASLVCGSFGTRFCPVCSCRCLHLVLQSLRQFQFAERGERLRFLRATAGADVLSAGCRLSARPPALSGRPPPSPAFSRRDPARPACLFRCPGVSLFRFCRGGIHLLARDFQAPA